MAKEQRKFTDDGWAIWVDGDDVSTVYLNDWLNPKGTSYIDVAVRIHQFMGTIYRDFDKHGVDTLFVFTHGTTLRAFLLRWFHYSPEWYQEEPNPKNCMIREIIDGNDLGYINRRKS